MKYLKRFLLGLVYLLPATLYCSYYPIIRLGETSSMNLELSLPLIWLVLFDTLAFIYLIRITPRRRLPGITDRRFFLFSFRFSPLFQFSGQQTPLALSLQPVLFGSSFLQFLP